MVGITELDTKISALTSTEILENAYAPIRKDLEEVGDTLKTLTKSHSPFLLKLLGHALDTTGKRVRPAITLLSSRFNTNEGHTPKTMASAVELLHIATLIHDDTVDNSSLRRGQETISSMWGKNAAVLIGDFIFATSATFVCDTGNIKVVRRFAETIMELSSGELSEMSRSYDTTLTRNEYFERIYEKTASLFTTASESGAILSGAPDNIINSLHDYGYNLGMAFQITDDILDFEGTSEETGKPVGRDLAQGILTLPTILALERNSPNNPIAQFCARPEDQDNLVEAISVIQTPEIIESSYQVADDYSRNALDALKDLPQTPERDSLETLVSYLVKRRV